MNRNNVTTTVIQIMSASQTLSHAVMNANNSPNEANPNRTVTDTQVNKSMKMSPATKLRYRLMADCVPEIAKSFKHFFRLMLHIEPPWIELNCILQYRPCNVQRVSQYDPNKRLP
jgi:hypothetical protein